MNFIKFCIVGGLGFIIDSSVYSLFHVWLSPLFSRLLSFFCAVCFTYLCNKRFTFHNNRKITPREFTLYFVGMIGGGVINLVTFLGVIEFASFSLKDYLGIAIGSCAGLFFNFYVSGLCLLDDAEAVWKLLSAEHLSDVIKQVKIVDEKKRK